jgi:high-affinity nickel permease
MAKAYGWAFANPIRKLYYNMSTVALGVFVAGGVGAIEYLQVLSSHTHLHGPFWDWLNGLDFQLLGYVIVGAFIAFWAAHRAPFPNPRHNGEASIIPRTCASGGACGVATLRR